MTCSEWNFQILNFAIKPIRGVYIGAFCDQTPGVERSARSRIASLSKIVFRPNFLLAKRCDCVSYEIVVSDSTSEMPITDFRFSREKKKTKCSDDFCEKKKKISLRCHTPYTYTYKRNGLEVLRVGQFESFEPVNYRGWFSDAIRYQSETVVSENRCCCHYEVSNKGRRLL